jgi:hypothetical protein
LNSNRCTQNLQAKGFLANFDYFFSFELGALPRLHSYLELDQPHFLGRSPLQLSFRRSQDS